MNKKIARFLFGKTKNPVARGAICCIYILCSWILIVRFFTPFFFCNRYKYKNYTFYCDAYTKYGTGYSEKQFHDNCMQLSADILKHPMYKEKIKISFFFCSSHGKYVFLSPFLGNSVANAFFLGVNHIVFNKTDFTADTVTGGLKRYNIRKIRSVLMHECTHLFSKGTVSFFTAKWKKEGLCEYYANDSSYSVAQGWSNLLSGTEDKVEPYHYFLYRAAVTYLLDVKKMTISEMLSDRLSLEDVLKSIILYIQKTGNNLF